MSNARSGMGVSDECKRAFMALKQKKTYRYVIFKIDESKKEIVVERMEPPESTYQQFTDSLPENEPRYAVFDFDFVNEDNCQKSKIFFIAWSPDIARIRTKFIYATSKDRFTKEFDGIHAEVQATDPTEIGIDVIRSRAY